MQITRQDLLQVCDKFLQGEISREDIVDYAWAIIAGDDQEWEDDFVARTLFEWDNEKINFPINQVNMTLWKKRLLTGAEELVEHNVWNVHIELQQAVCRRYGSKWTPISKNWQVFAGSDLTTGSINGLRRRYHSRMAGGRSGWFLWTGEYSEAADFFQPLCAEELLQIRPAIIKYLGLEAGFLFYLESDGDEKVWRDETILRTQ
ncbi:MAG: hypothetical protein EOO10_08010 [Chitinophagaceae bacterium]|nr:MAG: hypothetical protein EOO10_08010 [Chitinophagaceae bacterium]